MNIYNIINFLAADHFNLIELMCIPWLVFAFFFLMVEMASPGYFFFISFFVGGLAAAIASCFSLGIIIQVMCAQGVSLIVALILRYWLVPRLVKRHHERTNVYALPGKIGFVVKNISFEHPGLVRVDGELWAAKVVKDELIICGDVVEVIAVRGAHVVVKKCERLSE